MAVLPRTAVLLAILLCLQGTEAFADGKFLLTIFFTLVLHVFACRSRLLCANSRDCYYAALLVAAAMKNSCCSRAQVGARKPEVYGRPFGTLKSAVSGSKTGIEGL